MMKSFITAD